MVAAAAIFALAAPAALWLRGRDAGRALPLGARLTAQWSAAGIRHGIEGREVEHLWSQLLPPRVSRGHLVIATRSVTAAPFCLPPALLHDCDAEWLTDRVRTSLLAEHGVQGPASADTRTRGHLLMALLVLAAGAVVVDAGDLPHLWISAAFVVVVAIRWIGPVLARRHIRTRGSAVILEGGGGGRVILPVATLPAGLVAEAEPTIRANRAKRARTRPRQTDAVRSP